MFIANTRYKQHTRKTAYYYSFNHYSRGDHQKVESRHIGRYPNIKQKTKDEPVKASLLSRIEGFPDIELRNDSHLRPVSPIPSLPAATISQFKSNTTQISCHSILPRIEGSEGFALRARLSSPGPIRRNKSPTKRSPYSTSMASSVTQATPRGSDGRNTRSSTGTDYNWETHFVTQSSGWEQYSEKGPSLLHRFLDCRDL